jgi:hypothetical protein
MDIDVVLGSVSDQYTLMPRYRLSPHTVVTISALEVVEKILAKTGAGARIGRLRIFNITPTPPLPASQLARLRGLFETNGHVEIFTSPSGSGGQPNPSKFGRGNIAEGGIGGGYQLGGIGSVSTAGNISGLGAPHLSSLLNVPVQIHEL